MTSLNGPNGLHSNRILGALPAEDRDRLVTNMVPVALPIKTVLFEPGEPIRAVHFPLDGVVSLVTPLDDGAIVEVATVGNEGIVGVPLVPGGSLAVRAISQEFLGQMLGSRRATVTLSAGLLQAAGLIRYHRGHISILDREGLEGVACECYGSIKRELDRVGTPPRNGTHHPGAH